MKDKTTKKLDELNVQKSISIKPSLWQSAMIKAKKQKTSLSGIIVGFLEKFVEGELEEV